MLPTFKSATKGYMTNRIVVAEHVTRAVIGMQTQDSKTGVLAIGNSLSMPNHTVCEVVNTEIQLL